jgi:uncharacterized protein (DUF433 family)
MIANPSSAAVESGPAIGPDVILGWFLQGRTRAEILADHPSLTSADIDAAFVSPAETKRIPEVTVDGRRLTLEEIASVQLPEALQSRMSEMVWREKRGRSRPGEKEILDDYGAFGHVMEMACLMAIIELRSKGA